MPNYLGGPTLSELADQIAAVQRGLDAQEGRRDLRTLHILAIASAHTLLEYAKRYLRWAVRGVDKSGQPPPPLPPT